MRTFCLENSTKPYSTGRKSFVSIKADKRATQQPTIVQFDLDDTTVVGKVLWEGVYASVFLLDVGKAICSLGQPFPR
jgi:hypothetical protein